MPLLAAAIVALSAISTFGDMWVSQKPLDQKTIPFLTMQTSKSAVYHASSPCQISDIYVYTDSAQSLQLGSFPCPSDTQISPTPSIVSFASACIPADIMIVVERSKNTRPLHEAAITFVKKVRTAMGTGTSVRFGLVSYGESLWPPMYGIPFPSGMTPDAGLSSDPAVLHEPLTVSFGRVESSLSDIDMVEKGGTCVSCGLYLARADMERTIRPDDPSVKHIVLLLSDGNTSHAWDGTYDTEEAMRQTSAEIDALRTLPFELYSIDTPATLDDIYDDICPSESVPDSVPSLEPTPYLVH